MHDATFLIRQVPLLTVNVEASEKNPAAEGKRGAAAPFAPVHEKVLRAMVERDDWDG